MEVTWNQSPEDTEGRLLKLCWMYPWHWPGIQVLALSSQNSTQSISFQSWQPCLVFFRLNNSSFSSHFLPPPSEDISAPYQEWHQIWVHERSVHHLSLSMEDPSRPTSVVCPCSWPDLHLTLPTWLSRRLTNGNPTPSQLLVFMSTSCTILCALAGNSSLPLLLFLFHHLLAHISPC